MFWGDLRQEEFENVIKETDGLCIVPLGCYERHGEHLPVRTDVFEAEALAKATAELEPACVFPAFEFGDVTGLVEYKGSIRLEPSLMMALLENYCDEIARNGFDKILLLNFHGGNQNFMNLFINSLGYKPRNYSVMGIFPAETEGPLSVKNIYNNLKEHGSGYYPELLPEDEKAIISYIEEEKTDGHGGFEETCIMLAIRPDLVKLDRMSAACGISTHNADELINAKLTGDTWILNFPESYEGHDPVGASGRIGKLLIRLKSEYIASSIRVYKKNNHFLKERRERNKALYL